MYYILIRGEHFKVIDLNGVTITEIMRELDDADTKIALQENMAGEVDRVRSEHEGIIADLKNEFARSFRRMVLIMSALALLTGTAGYHTGKIAKKANPTAVRKDISIQVKETGVKIDNTGKKDKNDIKSYHP